MTERKATQKKEDSEIKTFPIPFALGEIKENITITTNTNSNPSKEQKVTLHHSQRSPLQDSIVADF